MMTSQPSLEVHALDVPEPDSLSADFAYNFFVPDEGTSDAAALASPFPDSSFGEQSTSFESFARSRVPRYVKLSWTVPNTLPIEQLPVGQLAENMRKIVNEGDLSTNAFLSILLMDPDIAEKMHSFASGSLAMASLGTSDTGLTPRKVVARSRTSVVSTVAQSIVSAGLQQLQRELGVSFYGAEGIELKDDRWEEASRVAINVQLSSKLADRIVRRSILDPHSPYSAELSSLSTLAVRVTDAARQRASQGISDDDFRSYVPYLSVQRGGSTLAETRSSVRLVGFVIEKREHAPDGSVREFDPIIVDSPGARSFFDLRVRYGATYSYTVRSVVRATVPMVDDDSNDVALVDFLASSRPSSRPVVRCIELVPPPVPNDVSFVWNYEAERLRVTWNHPVNSQRDVKEYQVFRRRSTSEPFELLKVYRFNDAIAQNELTVHYTEDGIDDRLIELVRSPVLTHTDDEFDRSSSFVYAVCSIDAHGLTSNYSAQFRVGFDRFKNKLTKELVSHSGAPKPYPNMYLDEDLFRDVIRVSGARAKRMKLYLTPEFYELERADGRREAVLETTNGTGGSYALQFLNTDNQKLVRVEISIEDRRTER